MNRKYTRPLAENAQFRFFSTCSPRMLIKGINVKLNMSFNLKECKEYLKSQIKSEIKNIHQFDLLIYLSGGVPFINGTLNDVFSKYSDPKVKPYIYGILTRPISDEYLEKTYTNLCDISTSHQKLLFSPIYDSSYDGLCNISCLLGYFTQNSISGYKFHKISSSIIPFPPYSTSFMRLIENYEITGRDIVTITSTLHTYFSHLINMQKPPDQIFNYTLKICSVIMNCQVPPKLPLQYIRYYDVHKRPNFWPSTVSSGFNDVCFWRGDLAGNEDEYSLLDRIYIDEISDESCDCFSSIFSHNCSIVRGKDHCYLLFTGECIRKYGCKIIDPMTGIEKTFKYFEDLKRLSNFNELKISPNSDDLESIKQMIFICFDESLSSSFPAHQYLTCFVRNLLECNVSCVQGLIQFSSQSKIVSELNMLYENIDLDMVKCCIPSGGPHHWDAISLACDELDKCGIEYKNAVKRIVIFSSGQKDFGSKISLKEIACKLLNSKVIVDSVILNKTEYSKELATLCHITGGYSFNPEKVEEGFQLFDKSSFINIELRKPSPVMLIEGNRRTKPNHLTPSILTEEFIQNAIGMAKFDTDIVNLVIDRIMKERNMATPSHVCCKNYNMGIPVPRKNIILRELHKAANLMDKSNEEYDPDIVVLPLHSMLDIWKVFIKGVEGTPYEGKWFYLSVTFPDLYPIEPPLVQFISVPYNLNISSEGRICCDLLNQSYEPKLHVFNILQSLKEIFIIPSLECPLRIDALELYRSDYNHESYYAAAKESAEKVGKNDYNEFISEYSKIYDDVDRDLTDTDKIPPYMMSQISGKPIDRNSMVMASSGVYYDRNELIQLLRSNPNPICVITGKPLTDKLENLEKDLL